jgi:hypothetical protein
MNSEERVGKIRNACLRLKFTGYLLTILSTGGTLIYHN